MPPLNDDLRRAIDDLGIEISTSDDAMYVFRRLDALASTVARQYRKRLDKPIPAYDVLRSAAKREPDPSTATLIRRAASRVAKLKEVAETAEYGEFAERDLRRAERLRSSLYELLYEWLEKSDEDPDAVRR